MSRSSSLQILSDETDAPEATYTGVPVFTLGFDSQNNAFVEKVGKTKTTADE
jgi:hypothetical protein